MTMTNARAYYNDTDSLVCQWQESVEIAPSCAHNAAGCTMTWIASRRRTKESRPGIAGGA